MPPGQGSQRLAPGSEKESSGHGSHSVEPLAETSFCPQDVHVESPSPEYVPSAHGVHPVLPDPEDVPAGHGFSTDGSSGSTKYPASAKPQLGRPDSSVYRPGPQTSH